jgi:CHAT domain
MKLPSNGTTVWDKLAAEIQALNEVARKIQVFGDELSDIRLGLTGDEITQFVNRYLAWYGECLSLLPDELLPSFRKEYENKIKIFLMNPFHTTEGYVERFDERGLTFEYSYYQYFYLSSFAQKQILFEASKRPIQPYYKHDTPPNVKEQSMAKIKVLFLAANPTSTISLSLDEEMRAITEKIRISEHRDLIDVVSAWAVRSDDLLQAFNLHKPQIVHFSCHGNRAGEIILVDNKGAAKSVATKALKALFTTLKDNIQVVILNACYSHAQAEAIIEVINCAIGMNDSIGDQAAIIFAASFYRALGFGRSVQEAFDQGKVALLLEGIPEENTPELLVKEGIDPSQIRLVGQANPSPVSSLSSSGLSSKKMKRERLFNAYKVILNAANTYQVETQQINHIASPANISLTGVDEAVNEISLEDVDTDVLSIFFDLRGAFNEFTARLHMPEEGSWEDVLKNKHKVIAKADELKTTMNRHLKELES